MNLKDLPWGPDDGAPPEQVYAIVEIPRGTRTKYEYDVELGVFRLDRVLYTSMMYPTAYGFVPGTCAPDGDPIDILVMISEALDVGVLVEARPVGMLQMSDENGKDDKLLSIAVGDPSYRHIKELSDISQEELQLIEHFFKTYKTLERKKVESQGWQPRAAALSALRSARECYLKAQKGH
jgi:inorganic pyrophosphatase